MGVDRATRSVLRDLAKERALTHGDDDIAVVRAAYERVFAAWTAPAPAPTREDWVEVQGGAHKQSVLVVEPLRAVSPLSIFFIHGGGWSLGSAFCYAPLCRAIAAETGMRVVAPDFPQAPENPFPAGLEFLIGAAQWAREQYGGGLVLAGDSAGGTLAAVMCSEGRLKGAIKGQALFYPVLDLREGGRYPSRRRFGSGKYFLSEDGILGAVAWYCGEATDPADPRVSPIVAADFSHMPPTFILAPDYDPLRDEARHYAQLLKKSGARCELHRAKDTIHGCMSFSGRIPQGREAIARAGAFMKSLV